ncbi:hypothetical protein E2C01_091039 [Portunus trituberculatus]|uniref:Uncharacterized protein n=1 Tax=Portunus trituberculatus TaxID=210409 RepID=A0A5B7JI53_PORTR|nr:hypothetical protein [Portunus trituberculatus]
MKGHLCPLASSPRFPRLVAILAFPGYSVTVTVFETCLFLTALSEVLPSVSSPPLSCPYVCPSSPLPPPSTPSNVCIFLLLVCSLLFLLFLCMFLFFVIFFASLFFFLTFLSNSMFFSAYFDWWEGGREGTSFLLCHLLF